MGGVDDVPLVVQSSSACRPECPYSYLRSLGCPMTARLNRNAAGAWSDEAKAIAKQARALSGEKLDQLVRRLQRLTGRSREACWRFVLQTGLKFRDEHRRWTEAEIDQMREHLATLTLEETAKKLGRSAKSVRCALHRHGLKVREIRCDWMSTDSLARILRVRKSEIQFWIDKGWLEPTVRTHGKRTSQVITPEALDALYKHHLGDLMARNRVPSVALLEIYRDLCFVPKHTTGSQLLTVRRDKREREAYAASRVENDALVDEPGPDE